MSETRFSVLLADVEKTPQSRTWTIDQDWLARALEGTEALAGAAPGRVQADLSKNGREILVQGRAQVTITVPCARTLEPLELALDAPFYLLLQPRTPKGDTGRQPGGRKQGRAAHRDGMRSKTPEGLSDEDAATDYYEGETIVLDQFVREHLLLELPMFPVRSDLQPEAVTANGPPASFPPPVVEQQQKPLDPRLGPLAALAEAMKKPIKE